MAQDSWDQIARTTADRATTSLSAVDVPDLSVNMKEAATYEFEAVLQVASTDINGCKYAISCPSGTSIYVLVFGSTGSTGAAVAFVQSNGSLCATAFCTVSGQGEVVLKGTIRTWAGFPGLLKVQQAKVTSGTATVKSNSVLKIRKVD